MRSESCVPDGTIPKFDLPLQTPLPDHVPTHVVLANVASAPLPGQVIGIVRCLVGDVGEKGLAVTAVGVDEFDHLVGVRLRCIVVFGKLGQIASVLSEHRARR